MNNIVEEANLYNHRAWIQSSCANNRFYVNNIHIPREDDSEDSSNVGTIMSDSSE